MVAIEAIMSLNPEIFKETTNTPCLGPLRHGHSYDNWHRGLIFLRFAKRKKNPTRQSNETKPREVPACVPEYLDDLGLQLQLSKGTRMVNTPGAISSRDQIAAITQTVHNTMALEIEDEDGDHELTLLEDLDQSTLEEGEATEKHINDIDAVLPAPTNGAANTKMPP